MPFSLADAVLGSQQARKGAPAVQAKNAGGGVRAAPAPAGPAAPPPASEHRGASPGRAAEALLAHLQHLKEEWQELSDAVARMRAALDAGDIFDAFESSSVLTLRGREIAPLPMLDEGALPSCRRSEARSSPEPAVAAPHTVEVGEQAPHEPVSGAVPTDPEVKEKLTEVLELLRSKLPSPGSPQARLYIPPDLSLKLAREIASKVSESMTSDAQLLAAAAHSGSQGASQPSSGAAGEDQATFGYWKEKAAKAKDKPIPIDDVAGMLERLTGTG